jgi:hypothetical protein
MRCDYLRATFRGDSIFHEDKIQDLFAVRLLQIQKQLGGEWKHSKKPLNGYRIKFDLIRNDDLICHALTDGSGDAQGTHQIESVGHFAAEVKPVLDDVLGVSYSTARRDTCFDFVDDDKFTQFHNLCDIAREMGVSGKMHYDQIGQGWLGIPGETMTAYMGSRNSPVMIRIYTRGLKTLKEGGVDDPYRVRVEVEVKPGKKAAKDALSMLSDEQLFGCSKWSLEFMQKVGITGIERHVVGTVWKLSDKEKVFAHLVKQYGGLLEEILDQKGANGLELMIRNQRKVSLEVKKLVDQIEIDEEVSKW